MPFRSSHILKKNIISGWGTGAKHMELFPDMEKIYNKGKQLQCANEIMR